MSRAWRWYASRAKPAAMKHRYGHRGCAVQVLESKRHLAARYTRELTRAEADYTESVSITYTRGFARTESVKAKDSSWVKVIVSHHSDEPWRNK